MSASVSTVAVHHTRALEMYSVDPRGVPTAVKPSSWCALRSLAASAATCSLSRGEPRLKPYAAESIIVHAQPPKRVGGQREVDDNVHVVPVRYKRFLPTRYNDPLQHRLQRECKQQRTQGVALSHSAL